MKILENLSSPKDVKNLSVEELETLSKELREAIISVVKSNGGHLSSNLGIVDLTICLHKVFDLEKDRLFFDVSHQCYTHKILTGRAAQFPLLRQYHGLSGFQKRKESIYDCWEAGHSSTSLSASLGMAIARDLNHESYEVIPVIGDGALSSGMSMEALNEIGDEQRKMIIVFNDNNMSISKNVGALTHAFSHLRSSTGYMNLKKAMKKSLRTSSLYS